MVSTATALASTSTVEETAAGESEKSNSRASSTCSRTSSLLGGLKALIFDVQRVDRDRQQRNQVVAGVIGFRLAR